MGSRLGETPLAWASCLLAQNHTLVAWATTRARNPGRAPAHLAWARLSVSATVRTCTTHTHTQQRFPASSTTHSNTQSQGIHKPQRYKTKYTKRRGSSFPYLEVARRCLDSDQRSTTAQGGDLRAEQDNGTELGTKLTVKPYCKTNRHSWRRSVSWKITYVEWEQLDRTWNDEDVNPSRSAAATL